MGSRWAVDGQSMGSRWAVDGQMESTAMGSLPHAMGNRTATRGKNVLRWAPDGQEMGGRWAGDGEEIHFIEVMGKLFHFKFPLKTRSVRQNAWRPGHRHNGAMQ